MDNLHTYITNIRKNFNKIEAPCVWEQFVLQFEESDKEPTLFYILASLYVRGCRKIDSREPGKILFHFPVNAENPSASVSQLLLTINDDLIGFSDVQVRIGPSAFFMSESPEPDPSWEMSFSRAYKTILNRVGKVYVTRLPQRSVS